MNQAQRMARLVDQLNETALSDLLYALSAYGNRIGSNTDGGRAHIAALRSVIETYTRMAFGQRPERIAYPLATGLGKTQSAVAWIRAANRLDAGVSVLVCQEQIDSLEDFYRDLTKNQGVPFGKVGLLHLSPPNATLPSIDPADAGNDPVLLVTHEPRQIRKRLRDAGLSYCGVCETVKAVADFSPGQSWCRPCNAAKSIEYYHTNREDVLTRRTIYSRLNREAANAISESAGTEPDPTDLLSDATNFFDIDETD